MAEFQNRKAREDLTDALAKMGLQVSTDLTSSIAGTASITGAALGPGATAPSAIAQQGVDQVRYTPEPTPPPAATAPRDPDEG